MIFQENDFLKVINLEYGHRCRSEPVEAAIHSLQAKGVELEKFWANASAELTGELEETTGKEQEKKLEYSFMEFPVDFTKDSLEKVRSKFMFPSNLMEIKEFEMHKCNFCKMNFLIWFWRISFPLGTTRRYLRFRLLPKQNQEIHFTKITFMHFKLGWVNLILY